MPMLPFHAGWCLPLLPIPSSKIALTTHKLSIYPTLKLTTHTLPYPKTQQKTHNPQRFSWEEKLVAPLIETPNVDKAIEDK